MLDLIPFVLKEEEANLKELIKGKPLGIIFDGTTRMGEALAIVVRFVSGDTATVDSYSNAFKKFNR